MKGLVSFIVLCVSASMALADSKKLEAALTAAIPQLQIAAISESKIQGLYRVTDQLGQVIFSNEDGSFFLAGELYSTEGGRLSNLSELERQEQRIQQLASIKSSDKVTFPATGEQKASITIFTDIDCGYCRKLHTEVERMNELGITVNYLAFPRAGVGSSSYDKLVTVWCSEDQLDAMNKAKAGKTLPNKSCENPVAMEYSLGNKMGVSGTPAIVLDDGQLVPGYIPADQLAHGLGIL